jgi:hypothetical protein
MKINFSHCLKKECINTGLSAVEKLGNEVQYFFVIIFYNFTQMCIVKGF